MDEISSSHYLNGLRQFILITNRDNEVYNNAAYTFNKLASFEGAVIEGEDYCIYRVIKR